MGLFLATSKIFTVLHLQLLLVVNCRFLHCINAAHPLSMQNHREAVGNETDTGLPEDQSPQYTGVVQCPCATHDGDDAPLFGYIFWSDIVQDINNAVTSEEALSIIMCPTNYHDAVYLPKMTIQRSNVVIQCGAMGVPDSCIVDSAAIAIGENFTNVTIQGVEFVSLRNELSIGKGSQISLMSCRFSDTIFPGLDTLRSAVVSHGELIVTDSYFSGNYGGGAVHVVQHSASFTNVQFVDNVASKSEISASAIQVGNATNGAVANVSIIDCCFENNVGANIAFVHEGSLLLRNRGNAVLVNADGNTTCHGVALQNGTGTTVCKNFQMDNTSCRDAFHGRVPTAADAIAPATTPVETTKNITSSPVQPAPSAAPQIAMNVTNGTATSGPPPIQPPTPPPKILLTLEPTVTDKNQSISPPVLNLTTVTDDDSAVPLDITREIGFETSSGALPRHELQFWIVVTPIIAIAQLMFIQ